MITRSRKISVDDYPEHLNPFADDNEDLRNNRFNTTGRRRARPSLKDAWSGGGWEAESPVAGGGVGGGGARRASATASASPGVGPRYGAAALGRTQSDSYRLRYTSRSGYQALMGDALDAGAGRQGALEAQLARAHSFSYGRRESNPSPALDVAVTVRGPTPARPPPPRLSLSPPPPPPSEVQRQPQAPPPPRPLTQPPPPAPDATPGKPARRRFSFSRTLDAGSRLLLSPALLRRFRPGAAPTSASAKPPPRNAQPPAAPDLRGSIRRSQSQAIPTTPPPIGDASGLNSRAGSNWTLAEGGFPQRIPSYRPKKRRAPPPPAPAPVTVTPPPAETSDTTNADQQAEVGVAVVAPAAEEVTQTTRVVVTVAPATPPPSSPEEPPAEEVSVRQQAAAPGSGSPADAADDSRTAVSAAEPSPQEQPRAEGVAPLAEGEDMPELVEADDSRQDETEEKPKNEASQPLTENTSEGHPRHSREEKEPPAPSEAVSPSIKTVEVVEEQATELLEKSVGNSDSAQLASTAEGQAALSQEPSSSKLGSEEAQPANTTQVLTLTIREYKEPTTPSAEATEVSEEAKLNAETGTGENRQVTVLEMVNPTVEVETKAESTTAPEPADATASDVPPTEKDEKETLVDGAKEDAIPEESPKSALASFREDYLTKHYKGDLPVLQITESDLAYEKQSEVSNVSSALPVLHISEEDLRDQAAVGEASGVETAEQAANGPCPAAREMEEAPPSPRRSLDGGSVRNESPQPPPRQSSAQELNSKIYFRVLPPLAAGGAAGGGPPQLKTFAPPSSPPGRGPKPQPPLRNGVAASASGEASPPRTKSPLPTPRRRHQPVQRDA